MADLRSYNREFTTELINLYKSLPALWKIKSKDYSDRNKKNDAYERMINKMKEIEPEATKDTVKKKINSLRSSYRKELKKVSASIRSGAATEDIYEPSLWYFHLLDFLKDHETPRQSLSNFDDTVSQDESSSTLTSPPPRTHSREDVHSDNSFEPPSSHSSVPPPTPDSRTLPPRRMKKRAIDDDNNINEAITKVGNCITNWSQPQSLDRHDSFGQNVAHKLRNMSNEQRIYTEKIINEAIFEGELGNLNRHCSIFIPSNTNIPLHISRMSNNIPQPRNTGGFQTQDQIFAPDAENRISETLNTGGFPNEYQISDNLIFNSVPDAESQQSRVGSARNFVLKYVP